MEYKTKGVCSMAIQYDLDDEQKGSQCEIYRWLLWKHSGCSKACRRQPAKKLSHVWRESSAAADQLHVQTSLQQL